MPAKRKANAKDESATPAAVELVIKPEHLRFPHSIEIRRMGGAHVLEARLEDHRHSETVGAKTLQQILLDNGAEMPDADDAALVITFSPYNGAIMSIAQKATVPGTKPPVDETRAGETKTNADSSDQTGDSESQ